jgi:hypothetical protein
MTDKDDFVALLEEKIKELLRVAEGYRTDNVRLRQQIAQMSQSTDAKNEELQVLSAKYHSLRLAKTLTPSSEDVKDVKGHLMRVIREIDKCIALMNR